ncbi:Spy/CpxP family protein refolding chaperone [bacterium]|nr:Spy/CpxP family protein refolding chaperone [bacterium]
MKRTLMITVLGLALVGSALAQGGRGTGHGNRMHGRGGGQGFGDGRSMHCMLDLTEAQQEQAKAMRTEQLKTMKPYREQMDEKHLKLRSLRTADKVDSKGINKLIEEIGAIRIEIAKKHEAQRQKFRSILTEDQRVLLDSRSMGGRGMRGGRSGHRGHGGHGMRGGRGMHGGRGGHGGQGGHGMRGGF